MELKKCPFCGGEAEITFSGTMAFNWRGYIIAKCRTCGAGSRGTFYQGEPIEAPLEDTVGGDKEISRWNTRVHD